VSSSKSSTFDRQPYVFVWGLHSEQLPQLAPQEAHSSELEPMPSSHAFPSLQYGEGGEGHDEGGATMVSTSRISSSAERHRLGDIGDRVVRPLSPCELRTGVKVFILLRFLARGFR
jgi:hypothetical protein